MSMQAQELEFEDRRVVYMTLGEMRPRLQAAAQAARTVLRRHWGDAEPVGKQVVNPWLELAQGGTPEIQLAACEVLAELRLAQEHALHLQRAMSGLTVTTPRDLLPLETFSGQVLPKRARAFNEAAAILTNMVQPKQDAPTRPAPVSE